MKVESKYVIDGRVVNFYAEFSGMKIYTLDSNDDTKVEFYFTEGVNNEVIKKLIVEADMGQGTGYISNFEFMSVN